MRCGADQAIACPSCGRPSEPGARFCGGCGARLDGSDEPSDEPPPVPTPVAAPPELSEERRRATVLFADLSGYTAIAEQLDPEDTKALVDGALRRLSREVTDRGGHVDKYIGDNVMAVFGAPVAHEDDPERAVRAGLCDAGGDERDQRRDRRPAATSGVELALRVGINSGEVLAGRMGDEYTVIGDTVNVAARLQAASGIGAVTVGAATRRLTAAAIEYRDLEPLDLKGKAQPIPAWEALGIADPAARSRSRPTAAPLVGRQEELALLLSLFERARKESRPYLVTVFGQAGVGKSRLLSELATALAERADPAETLVGHCRPMEPPRPTRRSERSCANGSGSPGGAAAGGRREARRRHRGAWRARRRGSTPPAPPGRSPGCWESTTAARLATTSNPSRSAIGSSPPCAWFSSCSASARRWSSRSRTSTGRTRACSI